MPAPRKALASCKRPKRLPQISESERKEGIYKLKAIKTKHALKALELARKVLSAVKELQALEEVMSEEAGSTVHAQYNTVKSSSPSRRRIAISLRKWKANSFGSRPASKCSRTCVNSAKTRWLRPQMMALLPNDAYVWRSRICGRCYVGDTVE